MTQNTPVKHIEYPRLTMYQMIEKAATEHPDAIAYEFYGKNTTYTTFLAKIDQAARAFYAAGIRKGDAITICMPNTPQALICFYAINRIGAIANMIHPQSAQKEITFYLTLSQSRMILTVDMFYKNVQAAVKESGLPITILVTRMQEQLKPLLKVAFIAKEGKKHLKYPDAPNAMLWKEFLKKGNADIKLPDHDYDEKRTSVILYSGGTSGIPKGICLSDLNLNACSIAARQIIPMKELVGGKMLSCMPIFHGFGLCMNIHAILLHAATCILMPTFTMQSYAEALIKKKPNIIAGVPTIFEALLHLPQLDGAKLDSLLAVFCGGDSLSVELKKKVDEFLHSHGANIQIQEGYGLTECVTASCITPADNYRERSIGLPIADTTYAIVTPGTDEEVPRGTEGEIILTSPMVMLGYLNNPEETKSTLRTLQDGRTWLYTGDLGYMDEDGFVYFRQRIKRMIVTNGYNVYPSQIENVIESCPEVSYSCVIGIDDPHRIQRVKAYVVLADGISPSEEVRERIMDKMKESVAKYALPREIEFRESLPKTLVGKVAYRILEEEANAAVKEQQGGN